MQPFSRYTCGLYELAYSFRMLSLLFLKKLSRKNLKSGVRELGQSGLTEGHRIETIQG